MRDIQELKTLLNTNAPNIQILDFFIYKRESKKIYKDLDLSLYSNEKSWKIVLLWREISQHVHTIIKLSLNSIYNRKQVLKNNNKRNIDKNIMKIKFIHKVSWLFCFFKRVNKFKFSIWIYRLLYIDIYICMNTGLGSRRMS